MLSQKDMKRMKKDHSEGKHFSWSVCPWCWAEEKIKEEFQRRIIA